MKRRLAASVVVTMTMVAACTPSPQPEHPERPPWNPPQPVLIPPTPTADPTNVTEPTNPPAPKLPDAPVGEAGELVREGAHCFWEPASVEMSCDPGDTCNPPPPEERYEVACPSKPALPDAPQGAAVQIRGDGTCFYYAASGPMHCPRGARCNPPAARAIDVRCPSEPKAQP